MLIEFHSNVKRLLQNQPNEKVTIKYMTESWPVPQIGPRPPYYAHPQYEPSYPLI